MKKHIKLIITTISLVIISATACGPVKDCDQLGNEFYKHIRTGDINGIIKMLDPEAINHTPKELWQEGLEKKQQELGPLISVERKDFEVETKNNVTRIAIKYKATYTNSTMYERVEFVERNSRYLITYYKYDTDSTIIN